MAYNFKSIADVEVIAEPSESANVLIEENGELKKAPKTVVGGAKEEWDLVIEYDSRNDGLPVIKSGSAQQAYNKAQEGLEPKILLIYTHEYYETMRNVTSSFYEVCFYSDLQTDDLLHIWIDYRNIHFRVLADNTVTREYE